VVGRAELSQVVTGLVEVAVVPGLNRWLLLRQAMKRPESPEQVATINPYDPPRRETSLKDVGSLFVLWRIENRQQDDVVGDIEIRVACR
jgi:hypothetical protein